MKKGSAQLVGIKENFFEIDPPALPRGWRFSAGISKVARVAQIKIDYKKKTGQIELDSDVFENPQIPEGCKVFMFFHEIGHTIFREKEELCDEYAFWHSLRAGVTPFTCFLALAMYMPAHYQYRVDRLKRIILNNLQLKQFTDAD